MKGGLQFKRYFTKSSSDVFSLFEYERRQSLIKDPNGKIIYEMTDVEVPRQFSQIATDILAQKYFRKTGVPQQDGSLGAETSIKQVVHRLANCWKVWGMRYNYFATDKDANVFYDEIAYCLLNQNCAPNSPQWFNTGLYESYKIDGQPQGHYYVDPKDKTLKASTSAYERPQPHACFILSVKDDLVNKGGIMDLWVKEARIFKYGSGVGTNFSSLRGKGEPLSGGGTSSGLMSFLKIGDRAAGAIKSGGTTRRAAKMVCLDIDHPEIVEFVNWKKEEEEKARVLIQAGYDHNYEGEAYNTVSGQNSNNSVRVSKAFFDALEANAPWPLRAVSDGHIMKEVSSSQLWADIVSAAWRCADPGVQFDTTINEWHTCPNGGKIRASNPCSEYMFLDDTACNLASINLIKYLNTETLEFDVEAFEHTVRLWTVVLEISVLMAQFPSEEVAELSYKYRTLGLGYANLGSVLMVSGIPYDSDKARAMAGAITAIMTGASYKASAEMASFLGAFPEYDNNKEPMLRVIRNHVASAYDAEYEDLSIRPQGLKADSCPAYLLKKAQEVWTQALKMGQQYGYRNAQTTVIAPTGTIGLLMDCDTTGVEPDFALVKYKKLAGGGYFKIVNQSVPLALKTLGYPPQQVDDIIAYIIGANTLEGCPHISKAMLLQKGLSEADVQHIEKTTATAHDVRYLFNKFSIASTTLDKLGVTQEQRENPNFNLLTMFGISNKQIDDINSYVYGTETTEGAPHLKPEHLAVFDTANKCGKTGKRFIHASGHIRMMASVQPFISGAISKTINLPNDATTDDISQCYKQGWKLGLKAVALYRDGSKDSQPLSASKADDTQQDSFASKEALLATLNTAELISEIGTRINQRENIGEIKNELNRVLNTHRLPTKRKGYTHKAKVGGHSIYLRTGEYEDGSLGEIFIDLAKEGSTIRSLMNCFAIAVSVGLQHGVPLGEYVEKFIYTKFEPEGFVDHPNIKRASSLVDFVFKLLAYEYLGRDDLVQVPDRNHQAVQSKTEIARVVVETHQPIKKVAALSSMEGGDFQMQSINEHNKKMQMDAPSCNVCGHITLRSGSCYKCLNCGNSLGCS